MWKEPRPWSSLSLPRQLLDSRRTQQRLLHRAEYQILPEKPEDGNGPISIPTRFLKAEFHIESPDQSIQQLKQDPDTNDNDSDIIITPEYWTGMSTEVDLMLPNWCVYEELKSVSLPCWLFL